MWNLCGSEICVWSLLVCISTSTGCFLLTIATSLLLFIMIMVYFSLILDQLFILLPCGLFNVRDVKNLSHSPPSLNWSLKTLKENNHIIRIYCILQSFPHIHCSKLWFSAVYLHRKLQPKMSGPCYFSQIKPKPQRSRNFRTWKHTNLLSKTHKNVLHHGSGGTPPASTALPTTHI